MLRIALNFFAKEPKKYSIHDMHTDEKIGYTNTFPEAIDICANDTKRNHLRCYLINEKGKKESVWFGDSWKIGHYYREHGNQTKAEEFAIHNAKRIWGNNVELIPTGEPESFMVYRKR